MQEKCLGFEGCNGCSFYFLASFDHTSTCKKQFSSNSYLKLSLAMSLKYAQSLPDLSLMFLIDMFLIKRTYNLSDVEKNLL